MSLIFSRRCEYALQATLYIASRKEGTTVSAKELSKRLKIPYHFIGKIMQELAQKRILESAKGPSGGFSMAKRPEDVTLLQIIEAIDGLGFFKQCVLGFPSCGSDHPCPVHHEWGTLRERVWKMLSDETLAELLEKSRKPELSV